MLGFVHASEDDTVYLALVSGIENAGDAAHAQVS